MSDPGYPRKREGQQLLARLRAHSPKALTGLSLLGLAIFAPKCGGAGYDRRYDVIPDTSSAVDAGADANASCEASADGQACLDEPNPPGPDASTDANASD